MKCFLACFGSSKKKRFRKPPPVSSSSPAPSPKLGSSYSPVLQDLAPKRANVDESILAASHSPVKQEEVSFDSKSVDESGDEKVLVNEDSTAEQSNLPSASESGDKTLSSLGSYPPNHRYYNCRESDNEDEMEEYDVDDYDEDKEAADEVDDDVYENVEDSPNTSQERTPVSFSSMESRTRTKNGSTGENLNQSELSVKSQLKLDEGKDEQEHAVEASLSGWLAVSSQKTPAYKATARGSEAIPSETSASSHGSNSVRSFSDRPILGALTMDELKQILASSSPRRSPSHNADDRPIIGSVGSHWSEETPSVLQSESASSFKGIPNTTSKYREDKTVNWHSTPFETRLEQALKKSASGVPF